MSKEKMLSMTDFAKTRGMKIKEVKQAIKDGTISAAIKLGRNSRKLVLVDKANALLDESLGIDRSQQFEKHSPGSGHREGSMMVDPNNLALYSKARASKEVLAVQMAQIKYDKEIGSLVEVDEIKKAAKIVGLNLRNSLLNLPNKVSPILAAETDVNEVKRILHEEIRSALESLSRGDYSYLEGFADE